MLRQLWAEQAEPAVLAGVADGDTDLNNWLGVMQLVFLCILQHV